MQENSGKPVGMKIVIGQQEPLEDLIKTMKELNIYPDFITIDGSEGGSGATYKSMADYMGLPLIIASSSSYSQRFVVSAVNFSLLENNPSL